MHTRMLTKWDVCVLWLQQTSSCSANTTQPEMQHLVCTRVVSRVHVNQRLVDVALYEIAPMVRGLSM